MNALKELIIDGNGGEKDVDEEKDDG